MNGICRRVCLVGLTGVIMLVGACQRPEEVTTAASLVVSNTNRLKNEVQAYTAGVNRSREASEERLRSFEIEGSVPAEFVNRTLAVWKVADNKAALKLIKILRADSAEIAADPFSYSGYGFEFSQARTFSFGRIKSDTSVFDTIIKKTSKLTEKRSQAEQFELLVKFGSAIKDEIEALEKAKEGSAEPEPAGGGVGDAAAPSE